MPIVIFYDPKSLTVDQYNAIMADLQTHFTHPWDGLLDTIVYGSGDKLKVIDVWESQAKFGKFCETLIPMVAKHGLEMDPPVVQPCYAGMENGSLRRFQPVGV